MKLQYPRCSALFAAAFALTLAMAPSPARADDVEYEVKAALVYNFAKFVEWPDSSFEDNQPFVVCVIGHNPFGETLARSLQGRERRGRPFLVAFGREAPGAGQCHIAFFGSDNESQLRREIEGFEGRPVLTIAESPAFLTSGGMIEMVKAGANVGFNVNLRAVRKAELRMSALVLTLAGKVQQ